MSLSDLSSILWREREILELLLFKLEEEQLLLAAGRSRWLAHATREVELVLDQIRQAEVIRAAHSQAAALGLGLPADASLSQLADAAPMPWVEMLHQHRKAFLTLTAEIGGMAEMNRDLLTAGQRAARETMMVVTGSVETYGRDGQTVAYRLKGSLQPKQIAAAREGLSGRNKFIWLSDHWKEYFDVVPVTAGIATLERVEILAGLKPGQEVSLEDPSKKRVEKDDDTD